MHYFGKRLKELIEDEDSSISKIDSESSSISKQKLSKYLRDENASSPKFESIEEIANFFDIAVSYFFKKGPPDRYKKLKRLNKLITQLTALDDDEIKVLENIFTAYANKKAVDKNKTVEIEM